MTPHTRQRKVGLATVVSDDFLPGALVMISSFLAKNRWFHGDVIIVYDRLSEHTANLLTGRFPNVIMHAMSDRLKLRLDAVSEVVPWIGVRRAQFGSLEVLSLSEYDRIIFCDSDLLFLDTIDPLIVMAGPLICCGDGAYFRGNRRSAEDFSEFPAAAANGRGLARTFNSGFMILDRSLLHANNYDAALDLILADRWVADRTGHTDQMLFNLLFSGKQRLVSSIYNFTIAHREAIQNSTGLLLSDARVLHFNGPAKPWLPKAVLDFASKDPAIIAAFHRWQESLIAFSTAKHP